VLWKIFISSLGAFEPRERAKKGAKTTNNYDLEDEAEEVGIEDLDPTTIVNFFRKAMGIYDFQLTTK
jgi:hypothetical protein